MFGVTILGNNSALPAYDRHPTAQIITIHDQLLLIDCGEGTQIQMSRYKIKRSKIQHILISHLHGDHYFGLIGLLTSMGLLGREHDLHLYAPPLLLPIIQLQLQAAKTELPFTLHFIPIEKEGLLIDEKKFTVRCFATQHRIDCMGFFIEEKKAPRKINKATIGNYDIPTSFYERLKEGFDYNTKQGDIVKNEWVTIENTPPKSYAYTADTLYFTALTDKVFKANVLYHEATYLKALADRAATRFHSTAEQAALTALHAKVGKLLLGHFSSKYSVLDDFLLEAKEVFTNTELAIEGVTFIV
jgi:ribonuclease Z